MSGLLFQASTCTSPFSEEGCFWGFSLSIAARTWISFWIIINWSHRIPKMERLWPVNWSFQNIGHDQSWSFSVTVWSGHGFLVVTWPDLWILLMATATFPLVVVSLNDWMVASANKAQYILPVSYDWSTNHSDAHTSNSIINEMPHASNC